MKAAFCFSFKGCSPTLSCQVNGPCAANIEVLRGWTDKDEENNIDISFSLRSIRVNADSPLAQRNFPLWWNPYLCSPWLIYYKPTAHNDIKTIVTKVKINACVSGIARSRAALSQPSPASKWYIPMCKTPRHTRYILHNLKPELMTFDVVLFRKTANMRSQPLFQHSPCAAWYSLNPVLNRHEKPLPSVTHPLFAPWCLWLICSTPASSDPPHTHTLTHSAHWHTARSYQPLLLTVSKSNWVKEIHFGFFFSPRCSVRQLLWWWDTKTTPSANVHMGGKITEFMFVMVCVCVCEMYGKTLGMF